MDVLETTDPALEIATIATDLSKLPASAEGLPIVLSRYFQADIKSPEFLEIAAVLRRRLDRLDQFAEHLVDPSFGEEQRTQVREGVGRLSSLLNVRHFATPWAEAKKWAVPEDALALMWFSQIAKRHRPLKKLTEKERVDLLAELESLIPEIQNSNDLKGWNREVLLDGLEQLKLKLRYLAFFGLEEATANLFLVERLTASALDSIGQAAETAPDGEPSALYKLTRFVGRAVFAATLFSAPDQAITALGHYTAMLQSGTLYSGPAVPQKQLPGPQYVALPPKEGRDEKEV